MVLFIEKLGLDQIFFHRIMVPNTLQPYVISGNLSYQWYYHSLIRGAPLNDSNRCSTSLSAIYFSYKPYRWFGIKDNIFIEVNPCCHNGVILAI